MKSAVCALSSDMGNRLMRGWPLLFVLSAGCGAPSRTVPATKPQAPVAQPPGAGAVVVAPPVVTALPAVAPVAPLIDAAAVRALFDRWLAAQNAGTFDVYSSLYAERFNGTKRVGRVARTYDRKGWLADRGRMFSAPMQVTAANLEITTSSQSATVTFTQTYAQKSFRDVGTKQLVVLATPAGLKITREEMMASAPAIAVDDAMPVLKVAGGFYVALSEAAPDAPAGAFESLGGGDGYDYSGRRKVSLTAADPTGRRGQELFMYPGGARCKISEVYDLAFGTPHFMTTQGWRTGDIDGDGVADEKPLPEADQNEQGVNAHMLAGSVDQACAGDLALVAPGIEWANVVDAGLEKRALRAFAADASVKDAQEKFAAEGKTGTWYQQDTGDVSAEIFSDGRRKLVVVGAAWQSGGCADFSASIYLVYEVVGTRLLPRGETVGLPSLAVAEDAKSLPVLVVATSLSMPDDNGSYEYTRMINWGYQDCPC